VTKTSSLGGGDLDPKALYFLNILSSRVDAMSSLIGLGMEILFQLFVWSENDNKLNDTNPCIPSHKHEHPTKAKFDLTFFLFSFFFFLYLFLC
jgi:hypothetical protein